MKILPAVDIISGKTVRLEQGRYDRELNYDITPIEAALKWESMGAEILHVIDLDGAKQGRPMNLSVVEEIAGRVKVPVETGGGYRKKADIEDALNRGLWRVIIGSGAFKDIGFAESCVNDFGDRVIFSVDAMGLKPCVEGWEKSVDIDVIDILKEFVSFGVKEVIYTDIKKDGMLSGPAIDRLSSILNEVDVKIISAGGVKTVKHINELKELEPAGLSGVIVGRALYEGTIDLGEAINAGKADNPVS